MALVKIRQFGLHLHAAEGTTLLDCLRQAGLDIISPCNGKGLCKQCRVLAGRDPDENPEEVLACQARVKGDVAVTIPEKTLFTQGRVMVSSTLAGIAGGNCRDASKEGKVLPSLGVAIDLGTTTIAAYLADLDTGATLDAAGMINPQIVYGTEIIARLDHALSDPANARRLREKVTRAMEDLIVQLCHTRKGFEPHQVKEIVVVGNTAMHHIVMNADISRLARSPFIPSIHEDIGLKASELGMVVCADATVTFPAPLAGFIGSDHVAALFATGIHATKHPVLLIDIGTNTEISLMADGLASCVSCASGGAFEGHHISSGMMAVHGAIDHITMDGSELKYHTIGGGEAEGICGSGIFDALALMKKIGVIDQSGRIRSDHPRLSENSLVSGHLRVKGQKIREFIIAGDEKQAKKISVTQEDVRALQLAKAAISTGIKVLLKERGLQGSDVAEVILAGGFGSYLRIGSAIAIGMLPDLPMIRFRQVGNAAGVGARKFLLSGEARVAWRKLKETIRCHELVKMPGFQSMFISELSLRTWQ